MTNERSVAAEKVSQAVREADEVFPVAEATTDIWHEARRRRYWQPVVESSADESALAVALDWFTFAAAPPDSKLAVLRAISAALTLARGDESKAIELAEVSLEHSREARKRRGRGP